MKKKGPLRPLSVILDFKTSMSQRRSGCRFQAPAAQMIHIFKSNSSLRVLGSAQWCHHHRTSPTPSVACFQSGMPQSLFYLLRCCSWYCLESSQGRGPRMFFHSSKFFSFSFCREKPKKTHNKWEMSSSRGTQPTGQLIAFTISAYLILLLQDNSLILNIHSGLQWWIQLRNKTSIIR